MNHPSRNSAFLASIALSTALALWYYRSKKTDSQNVFPSKDRKRASRQKEKSAAAVELPQHLEREIMKEKRRKEKAPMLARKSPMYDNIQMIDPNGELLCTISAKKSRWYVKKGLATWTDSSQGCIQLNFEPRGYSSRGEGGCYVRATKNNVCFACGDEEFYRKHYVVPYAYRSRLPAKYKSHISHDVVILCPDCHLHCEQECQKRMSQIEDLARRAFNLDDSSRAPFLTDSHLYNVRSNGLALLRWRDKIPKTKLLTYERRVRHHLGLEDDEDLTPDLLQKAIDVEYRIPNPNFVSGAEVVVRSLGNDDSKIEQFVKDWRRYFLESAHPHFLPEGWSVDSPVSSDER